MSKDKALKLAAEFDKRFISMNGIDVPERVSVPRDEWRALHDAIKQALAVPVQEPVAVPKIEWVNTSSDWVVRYLQAKSIFNAEQIGEMMDFAALAANKFYATQPAAQPATEDSSVVQPEPVQQGPGRTDREIVDQTEELAGLLMRTFHRREKADPLSTFRGTQDIRASQCWQIACQIQEMLTDTDPMNAVAEVDDEAAHGIKDQP